MAVKECASKFCVHQPIPVLTRTYHYVHARNVIGRARSANIRPFSANARLLSAVTRARSANPRPFSANARPFSAATRTRSANARPLSAVTRTRSANLCPLSANARPLSAVTRAPSSTYHPFSPKNSGSELAPSPFEPHRSGSELDPSPFQPHRSGFELAPSPFLLHSLRSEREEVAPSTDEVRLLLRGGRRSPRARLAGEALRQGGGRGASALPGQVPLEE